MSKCKLSKSNTSCKTIYNKLHLIPNDCTGTLRNKNDADNYTAAESSFSLLEATRSQVRKRILKVPNPRVLNICTLNSDKKGFEVPKGTIYTSQTGEVPIPSYRVGINKPKHARPSFLYEQYPLKPALLYDSPLSFVRDPLNRLDQITYLPQSSLHSIASVLPTCSCVIHSQFNPQEDSLNIQNSRLISGEEECRYFMVAKEAWKTREAFASTEDSSLESICATSHRKGFSVPQFTQYYMAPTEELEEPNMTRETNDTATKSDVYNTASQSVADTLVCDNEKHLAEKDSFLFYNPYYHYEGENGEEAPAAQHMISLNNSRLTISANSYKTKFHDSVPIFEVLSTKNIEDYSNQPALKHKDSLLLYANLKQKRLKRVATLDVGERNSLRFITFFDEAQLANKSSDEDIIFGSARGIDYKFQSWEESRIAWLSELERRQEVHRRRQKRAELRKLKKQAAKSRSGQCSFWFRRLRSWLAKWHT